MEGVARKNLQYWCTRFAIDDAHVAYEECHGRSSEVASYLTLLIEFEANMCGFRDFTYL